MTICLLYMLKRGVFSHSLLLFPLTILSSKDRILYRKNTPKNSICKIDIMQNEIIINAELSLQSASQNSRINHQQQSWSQIREK